VLGFTAVFGMQLVGWTDCRCITIMNDEHEFAFACIVRDRCMNSVIRELVKDEQFECLTRT
jgi:hypothetical protein